MSLLTGYAHFMVNPRKVTADRVFWRSYCVRNLSNVIKTIMDVSNNLRCAYCGEFSPNYTKKSSLFSHYRGHCDDTIDYYLDNFITKSAEEIKNNCKRKENSLDDNENNSLMRTLLQ